MCRYTPANQHLEPKSHEALGIFFQNFLFIFCWWIFRDSDPLYKSVTFDRVFPWKKKSPSFEALLFWFRGPRASKASKWHHGGHDAEDGRGLCSPCFCDGWSNWDVYPGCWWAVIRGTTSDLHGLNSAHFRSRELEARQHFFFFGECHFKFRHDQKCLCVYLDLQGSLAKSVQRKLEEKEDEEVLQSYYEMGKAHMEPGFLLTFTKTLIKYDKVLFRHSLTRCACFFKGMIQAWSGCGDSHPGGQAWMETSSGQEMLEEAKKRKPDALEIRINIQAPRLYFPVRGKAGGSCFDKVEVELRAMHYVGNSGANLESKHNCCQLLEVQLALNNRKLPVFLWDIGLENCEVTSLQKTTISLWSARGRCAPFLRGFRGGKQQSYTRFGWAHCEATTSLKRTCIGGGYHSGCETPYDLVAWHMIFISD